MNDIESFRTKIDGIDEQLLNLLNQRMNLVQAIGAIKNKDKSPIYRPERESLILDRLANLNAQSENNLLSQEAINAIFLEIFSIARNLERQTTVAFLGPSGSFTHQAAESIFGTKSHYVSLSSIHSVFNNVSNGNSDLGVVPIENNKLGIVTETVDLLTNFNKKIVAEIYMPIHLCLASLCEDLAMIKKIYSKDAAFFQCRNFIREYNLEHCDLIEVNSTSKAAQIASKEAYSAAISSEVSAKMNRLPILYKNIEDISDNKTRFIILGDFNNARAKNNKTSIILKTEDKPGSLLSILQVFKASNINLLKLDSRPLVNFKSLFYIDFEGHYKDESIAKILRDHDNIKLLGSYVNMLES